MRGFFGIGVFHGKTKENIGTLMRSAHCFGASFVFTVGRRYDRQCSDTTKAERHIPIYNYSDIEDLIAHLPKGCRLVGVETVESARSLSNYSHPDQAAYLLGAEDHGISEEVLKRCHEVIRIDGARFCLNVAVAGSIVLHHRVAG